MLHCTSSGISISAIQESRAEVLKEARAGNGGLGDAASRFLLAIRNHVDARRHFTQVLAGLPSESQREKFCLYPFLRESDAVAKEMAVHYLLRHRDEVIVKSVQGSFPEPFTKALIAIAQSLDQSRDAEVGATYLETCALLERIQRFGGADVAVAQGAAYIAERLGRISSFLTSSTAVEQKQQDVAERAVVGVLLHGGKEEEKQLRICLRTVGAQHPDVSGAIQCLLDGVATILNAHVTIVASAADRDTYARAAKRVGEIQRAWAIKPVADSNCLARPSVVSSAQQFEAILGLPFSDIPGHETRLKELTVLLRDQADRPLAELVQRVRQQPEAQSIVGVVFACFREQTTVPRVVMVADLARQSDAIGLFAAHELVTLAIGKASFLGRPQTVRDAAFEAFWALGDPRPIFYAANRKQIVNLYRSPLTQREQKLASKNAPIPPPGLFRSREHITQFVHEVVLTFPDRAAAFELLRTFRLEGLLSKRIGPSVGLHLEPEFRTFISGCSLEELGTISLHDEDAVRVALDIVRRCGITAEKRDKILILIETALPGKPTFANIVANSVMQLDDHVARELLEQLLRTGHWAEAAGGAVGLIAEAELAVSSDRTVMRIVGQGLLTVRGPCKEYDRVAYARTILDRIPLEHRAMVLNRVCSAIAVQSHKIGLPMEVWSSAIRYFRAPPSGVDGQTR